LARNPGPTMPWSVPSTPTSAWSEHPRHGAPQAHWLPTSPSFRNAVQSAPLGAFKGVSGPFSRRRARNICMVDCCDDDGMELPVAGENQRNNLKVMYMQERRKDAIQPGVTKIVFDRGLGDSLGLDVECVQGADSLPIVAVKHGGFASRSGGVAVGDKILEVNGLRYDLETMMNICQTARYVELVVARGQPMIHHTAPSLGSSIWHHSY